VMGWKSEKATKRGLFTAQSVLTLKTGALITMLIVLKCFDLFAISR
jgi:hypothetical protein